ncbi:MAG: RsmD family RNA methyltransferase [Alphaproteobacteria bacterium]|nr:RsmD family RNA methyltransferase [Alphaproteobacteria bacterium]
MNSNLQIISGKFRGRKLALPKDARPTQNRARIALFNMLDDLRLSPTTVWDAFAGSGAFGIEFLSRGAARHVIFTDKDADSIKTINKNLAGFDKDSFTIKQADAIAAAAELAARADLVFVDPPYAEPSLGEKLVAALRPGTIVVWEMEGIGHKAYGIDGFEILKHKKYGRAEFIIMRKNNSTIHTDNG